MKPTGVGIRTKVTFDYAQFRIVIPAECQLNRHKKGLRWLPYLVLQRVIQETLEAADGINGPNNWWRRGPLLQP